MIYIGENKQREQFSIVGNKEVVEVRHGENFIWGKQIAISTSGDWIVPDDVSSITVCIIGGGKGGQGLGDQLSGDYAYGGTSGDIISSDLTVTPGETISIIIGVGGDGGTSSDTTIVDGQDGQSTVFGSYITAVGGTATYMGQGAARSTCKGTFYDGTYLNFSRGGQAGLGNGGNGDRVYSPEVTPPQRSNGTLGSGGGGAYISTNDPSPGISGGKGGDGIIYIDFNN